MRTNAKFDAWIAELRFVAEEVYSTFDLEPEHWRDDFDRGRSPHDAFDRIMIASAEYAARKRLS